MNWYFQYTPNDGWDYDEVGTHILIDGQIAGENRKLITHSARNGFTYTMERNNGQIVAAKPYMDNINWTKGIDQKTGKPIDYDPNKDVQLYAGVATPTQAEPVKRLCPNRTGGNNYWPSSYSPKTKTLYIPSVEGCSDITPDHSAHVKGKFAGGTYVNPERLTSSIVLVDPASGEQKARKDLPYPNSAGVLTTAGGIVVTALLDGTIVALDDQTLEELWKVNVGTGFNAPPMTYSVDGKQYIAIASGLWRNAKSKLARSPEMRTASQATLIWVFGM
jgi:alcohol dehydrogenase (cytochrome c)